MKSPELIPDDYEARLNEILDVTWRIFKSQFLGETHPVQTEAPFQHYFANILSSVGQLYCIQRSDNFKVDLETRVENIQGKRKFVDISCEFVGTGASCAIELKFKTAKQGAQNHGRVDAYVDIEALEQLKESHYPVARFYMITDSGVYTKKSLTGVGTVFATHHGYEIEPKRDYKCIENNKGRADVITCFKSSHKFHWESNKGWFFLEIKI